MGSGLQPERPLCSTGTLKTRLNGLVGRLSALSVEDYGFKPQPGHNIIIKYLRNGSGCSGYSQRDQSAAPARSKPDSMA